MTEGGIVQNGEKGIPVGKTIAVIAEPDDDLSSLTLPKPVDGGSPAAPAAAAAPPPPAPAAPAKEAAPAEPAASTPPSPAGSSQKTNPNQTLLPSVSSLAVANNMTAEQVIDTVPASGPNGRITKGDILAHLGKISKTDVENITNEIAKLQHLDLSNIKIKKPEEAPKKVEDKSATKESAKDAAPAAEKPKPAPPLVLNGLFTLSEIEAFRASLSAATGSAPSAKSVVEKAAKLASRDVPLFSQPKRSILNDPVFDALVAPSTRGLKPFEVSIEYPRALKKAAAKQDIFDLLAAAPKRRSAQVVSGDMLNVSVTVNKKYAGAEAKARVFLDRFGFYLSREGLGELTL
ncbi:hypothetical protein DV495_000248 [Geotrichum candidum]|nr:hypothetical protein DV452_004775 [Geotrichum candidum]KAI9210601.1 hypothetical protein DS838_004517 [Geotrichum bryndzae]KAF5118035.1 hypothetical protein DV454_000735 [Geotrichum candidum]KAF5135992.1 hypothetical protein DV495_000248 [Geotrichum candidum]KAF7499799.1 hypothetical protein DV113_002159 [Geotrichum candidum]